MQPAGQSMLQCSEPPEAEVAGVVHKACQGAMHRRGGKELDVWTQIVSPHSAERDNVMHSNPSMTTLTDQHAALLLTLPLCQCMLTAIPAVLAVVKGAVCD